MKQFYSREHNAMQ